MSRTIPSLQAGWIRVGVDRLGTTATRPSALALADQVVVSAVNFVAGVILGRCSQEQFGLYLLGFSIMFFLTTVQASLIATPFMIFNPRLEGAAQAEYAGSTLIHQFALAVVAMLVLAASGLVLWLGAEPAAMAAMVWALAGVVVFVLLREYARQICFAKLRMGTAFLLDGCAAIIQLGGLALLAWAGMLSASSAWWTMGAASCLAALIWLARTREHFTVRAAAVLADLKRNWSLGKWVAASGVVWALTTYLYPWILASFHGTASAGVWAACLGIVAFMNPLVLGTQNFVGPSIAHSYAGGDPGALRRHVFRSASALAAVLLPLSVVIMVFGGPLVALVYGDEYAGHGLVVFWLAMSTFVGAVAFAFSRALFAVQRAQTDFWANAVGLGFLLTAGPWLVWSYGLVGAAFGLMLGNVAGVVVRCVNFLRSVPAAPRPALKEP